MRSLLDMGRTACRPKTRPIRGGAPGLIILVVVAMFLLEGRVSAFSAAPLIPRLGARPLSNRRAPRPFAGAALSASSVHGTSRLEFGKNHPSLPALADKMNDANPFPRETDSDEPFDLLGAPSSQEHVQLSASECLVSLKPICNELRRQGQELFWVGASTDTLSQALAVQLKSEGFSFPGADWASTGALPGTFPGVAKQLRVEILRFITSNLRKLEGLEAADVELAAAAHRYGVKIICYEVCGGRAPSKVVFDPPQGFVAKAELRIARVMGLYISTLPGSNAPDQAFSNLSDEEVIETLRRRSDVLGLAPEPLAQASTPLLTSRNEEGGNAGAVEEVRGEGYSSQVIGAFDGGGDAISALSAHLGTSLRLESLASDRRQDFASALAKALHVANLPIQTSAVGSGKAGDVPLQSAARVARSDLIMFTAGHPRVASAPEFHRHPLAAAAKYKVRIECVFIADGLVHSAAYDPPAGVVPRGLLRLASAKDIFYAVVSESANGDEVESGEGWITASKSLPARFQDKEVVGAGKAGTAVGSREAEEGSDAELQERGPRRVVWDPKSLSWQVAYGDAADPSSPEAAPSAAGGASSFLPRFSAHHKNSKSAASVCAATVGDARLGASLAARNGKGAAMNFGGIGGAEFTPSEGIQDVERELKGEGLMLDRTDGACNLYLALAKLLRSAGLEVQGVMFTAFGEQQSALIGAMSRKARLDIKRYTNANMDQFQEMGRWLGDHDMAAAATVYRIRLIVHMIVFDKEAGGMDTSRHAYEPVGNEGHVRELHLCLDKGRFWPIYPSSDDGTSPVFEPLPPKQISVSLPKPRTALERVWADYGAKGQPEEMLFAPDAAVTRLKIERDWMDGTAHATPVVVDAKGKHTATIIWLHGLGGTGSDWVGMCEALRLPWVKFVLPTAKRAPTGLWNGTVVPSWFDVSAGALKVHSDSLNAGAATSQRIYERLDGDDTHLEASTVHVLSLIQAEIDSGIHPSRIVLAGYSQGASVSLNAAISAGVRLGGVAAFSMFQPSRIARIAGQSAGHEGESCAWDLGRYEGQGLSFEGDGHSSGSLPALFCHGKLDKVVTPAFGDRFYRKASSMGMDAEVKAFAGIGHSLCFEELMEFRSFVSDRCIPGGGEGYGEAPLEGGKSAIGRRWGDGSPVSGMGRGRSDGDLRAEAEQALRDFVHSWTDPSNEVWKYHLKQLP